MSKKKSRNIRTLPKCNLTFHQPIINNKEQQCFGEPIIEDLMLQKQYPTTIDLSNDGSIDSLIIGLQDLSASKSSDSSLSWGVGEENETTKVVKEELDRMERVLTGQETIPENYDSDEYSRWMDNFPRFCVPGTGLRGIPLQTPFNKYYEEVIAIDPEDDIHLPDLDTSKISEAMLKEAVIDHIYNKIDKRLNSVKSPQNITVSEALPSINIDVDEYLKISPILTQQPVRHLPRRRYSSRSLISSQISSSKWLKDDSNDFTSLPFLVENFTMEPNIFYHKNENKAPKSILKSNLVLPPIDQFRSISATPRRGNKYSPNISSGKSRIESTRSVRQIGKRLERNKSCGDDRFS